jgi:hypothetical protein
LPPGFIAACDFRVHAKRLCECSLSRALSLWLEEHFLNRLAQALARIVAFDPNYAVLAGHVAR